MSAELHHLTCCDDDIAICGADVSGQEWSNGDGAAPCLDCARAHANGEPCQRFSCTGAAWDWRRSG